MWVLLTTGEKISTRWRRGPSHTTPFEPCVQPCLEPGFHFHELIKSHVCLSYIGCGSLPESLPTSKHLISSPPQFLPNLFRWLSSFLLWSLPKILHIFPSSPLNSGQNLTIKGTLPILTHTHQSLAAFDVCLHENIPSHNHILSAIP